MSIARDSYSTDYVHDTVWLPVDRAPVRLFEPEDMDCTMTTGGT